MGGQAFLTQSPPLPTPRMPFDIYTIVLKQTLDTLRKHYTHADAPIEGPGKDTHGDVDVLVTGPLNLPLDPTLTPKKLVAEILSKELGAKAFIFDKGNPTINFAVPWPEQTEGDEEKYVQIDVHWLDTPASFKWELFHSAHGDLWNILGTSIRPFGLTVNDVGLYLRIPEIELLDRKKSMVFLTSDPGKVLEFLGLKEEKWWKQFGNRNEMFEYAAGGRFFWVKPQEEEGDEAKIGDALGEFAQIEGQEGGEKGKKKLKHNDRKRMSQRPIFREWIDEFIPKCRESGKYTKARVTREQIRDEAFEMFGVGEEYEGRRREWMLATHRDELGREAIKGSIPIEDVVPQFRAAAIRTLKDLVLEEEVIDGLELPQKAKKNEEGFWDIGAVRDFVVANWKLAGQIGWKRQQERAMETMKIKAEKRKREELEKKVDKVGRVG
jgi:hypothetical protein